MAQDRNVNGLPRERSARTRARVTPYLGKGGDAALAPRRAALWGAPDTLHETPAVWGAYPQRFLPWALRLLHATRSEVLHVCSGGLEEKDGGLRLDIRIGQFPDVAADARALPFRDGTFRAVLIDPPYTVEYAESLYQTDYPRPSHLLKEAVRVTRPGGRIGMLHFLVPHSVPGSHVVTVRGVTQGCGYRIRALTIFERNQEGLYQ